MYNQLSEWWRTDAELTAAVMEAAEKAGDPHAAEWAALLDLDAARDWLEAVNAAKNYAVQAC